MYKVERQIHEEDMYMLSQEDYDYLPNGTVLYDITMQDTFVKGAAANYTEARVVVRGALGMDVLNVGWTHGMAASQ